MMEKNGTQSTRETVIFSKLIHFLIFTWKKTLVSQEQVVLQTGWWDDKEFGILKCEHTDNEQGKGKRDLILDG